MSALWSTEKVEQEVKNGTVHIGKLRVNAKQHKDAYITVEGEKYDVLIEGFDSRNRAFHDDIVAVEILSEDEWKSANDSMNDSCDPQWKGRVVKIMQSNHNKYCAGHIKRPGKGSKLWQFMPRNRVNPFMIFQPNNVVEASPTKKQQAMENVLFLATIDEWPQNSKLPHCTVIERLGEAGEVDTEMSIILKENSVIDEEFSDMVTNCLPTQFPWRIPSKEFDSRLDLRKSCIFTVDPSTARDLDDALSCRENEDGTWTVGVHIADVSYFIEERSPLDQAAEDRATSVYLINRVIPMFPRVLCENLCSLNPGEDRLAYSVLWKMDSDGNILETSFHRSIIRSCAKLAYGHAQALLDGKEMDTPLPPMDGEHSVADIVKVLEQLWAFAKILRDKRFDNGALKLNQPKIVFQLDSEGNPTECSQYKIMPSHSLIEEFMLQANISVAEKIHSHFPGQAVLRRHPFPKIRSLLKAVDICAKNGIHLDCIDARAIQKSIDAIAKDKGPAKNDMLVATVTHYCSKAMELAQYFCSSTTDDAAYRSHYALSIPIYTHFTSPIRRYPDVMVHRLLTAALSGTSPVANHDETSNTTHHCNGKRLAARRVQDSSSELYFKYFIQLSGSFSCEAVVVGVLDRAVDVLLLINRKILRVHQNKMQLALDKWMYDRTSKNEAERSVTLVWKGRHLNQKLAHFTKVTVALTVEQNSLVGRIEKPV